MNIHIFWATCLKCFLQNAPNQWKYSTTHYMASQDHVKPTKQSVSVVANRVWFLKTRNRQLKCWILTIVEWIMNKDFSYLHRPPSGHLHGVKDIISRVLVSDPHPHQFHPKTVSSYTTLSQLCKVNCGWQYFNAIAYARLQSTPSQLPTLDRACTLSTNVAPQTLMWEAPRVWRSYSQICYVHLSQWNLGHKWSGGAMDNTIQFNTEKSWFHTLLLQFQARASIWSIRPILMLNQWRHLAKA